MAIVYKAYDTRLESEVARRTAEIGLTQDVTVQAIASLAEALAAEPDLAGFAGRVSDSGEGRWTLKAAIDEGVPAPVLSAALYQRFSSRGESGYADRILSAMRAAFGGHREKP